MTSILDLKNSKNRKINSNHSVGDILSGDLPAELEPESAPVETLPEIDSESAIPNNTGDMTPIATFTSTSLAWTAPDKHHELISHVLRKWIIIILVVMAFVTLFWQGSILTGITFFALALVTSMHFWREARHEQYEIHPHGITVGSQFYHYHDLDSFWIHYHPKGYHELSLCTGRLLNHYIKVSLKDQDPFEIRDALMMYLPEKRHEEGLEDWLRRGLGL